jgi:hypothetical protein
VIVDEGQDLLAEAMLRSVGEHVDGGWTGGCWRFFFDPNQDLLGRPADGEWELLEAAAPAVVRLSMNCRNTQRIIELTALLSGASDLAASEVIGPVVTVCSDWNLPHRERVRRQLDRLATSGVPAGEVVVLVTDTFAQHELAEALGLTVGAVADGETRCLTISEFKGRESPVVVLAGPTGLDDEAGRRLAYVGASRARVELVAVLPADAAESYVERLADYAERLAQRAQGGAGR